MEAITKKATITTERVVLIINGSVNQVHNSLEEAILIAGGRYINTFWQGREDVIEVRNLVTESNGYQHTGDTVLIKCNSSRFWAK